ncbi:peptidyl-prolyl cis-trans isomerase D [bacterium BMS3Abin14]|nr:peptidyl-prolyl cis-trans isomerase D [bacterium BMS3Abin14]
MLKYMRNNAGSWMVRIMLFGIAIIFAFWGVGSYSSRNLTTVLTIDKDRVPYSEYQDIYNTLTEALRQAYGGLDSKTLETLDIKGQAMDILVKRHLLLAAAKNLGITATSGEINGVITRKNLFFEGGVFSQRLFQAYLDQNRLTANKYKKNIAMDITIEKVRDLVELSAVVIPQEVDENLTLVARKIVVDLVKIDPNRFIRNLPPATEKDLMAFYDNHIEEYRVPERFTEAVVVIDPGDMAQRVTVSAGEIEDRYDENAKDYARPAAFRLRHILFSIPSEASANTIKAIRMRAEKVSSDLQEGKLTFDQAAKKWSDDKKTAFSGGKLGFLTEDELQMAIVDAASSLEGDEVSDPILTPKGFEVISVMERREESQIPLDEVRGKIKAQILKEKEQEAAYDLADDLIDEVDKKGKDIQDAAQAYKLAVVITPPFSQGALPRSVDLPRGLLKEAFNTEEGEIGDAFESGGKLYVMQTIKRSETYLPKLDEVRGQVNAGLLVKRALDAAYERGKEMIGELNTGTTLKSLAGKLRTRVITTKPFTILGPALPGVGGTEELTRAAFSIGKPGRATLVKGTQEHYLVVLRKVIPPDPAEVKSKQASLVKAMRTQIEQEVMAGYVESLKAEYAGRIEINKDLI